MATYSVSEAKNQFSRLIDRALAGEEVIITRHGAPVVELIRVRRRPEVNRVELEWIAKRRIRTLSPTEDAVSLVRRMRDEGP